MTDLLVENLLSILLSRKGFDSWWDDIDQEYQEEIREELTQEIEKWIALYDSAG